MMKQFKFGAGLLPVLALMFAACGPPANDGAEVHVTTSDSGTTTTPARTETTVVVQQPPADTVTNTVVEHRTDTVVKEVPGRTDTVARPGRPASTVSPSERARINVWLNAHADSLNQFGDPKGTAYAGGTPLFNEATGETINRFDYIVRQHPDKPWMQALPVQSTPRR